MKFAIINDMHVGPLDGGYYKGVQRKLLGETERLVTAFVDDMNNKEHPEFVVNLGDLIEDLNDHDADIQLLKKSIGLLGDLKMPVYTLVGNHDVRTLSQAEIAKVLGYKKMYYSFDRGGYHFIALSFRMTENHRQELGAIAAEVPNEQLRWLKSDLAKTDAPTIIFIHYGLADDDMVGNFWFESQPHKAIISNREQVRQVLEDSGKVLAVFSAHQHWNRMNIHGDIPYFTVTSLVENFNNDGVPAEAYTVVELQPRLIKVEVRGNDGANYEYVRSDSTFART